MIDIDRYRGSNITDGHTHGHTRRMSRGWVRGVWTHPCSSSWSLLYICNYVLNKYITIIYSQKYVLFEIMYTITS